MNKENLKKNILWVIAILILVPLPAIIVAAILMTIRKIHNNKTEPLKHHKGELIGTTTVGIIEVVL